MCRTFFVKIKWYSCLPICGVLDILYLGKPYYEEFNNITWFRNILCAQMSVFNHVVEVFMFETNKWLHNTHLSCSYIDRYFVLDLLVGSKPWCFLYEITGYLQLLVTRSLFSLVLVGFAEFLVYNFGYYSFDLLGCLYHFTVTAWTYNCTSHIFLYTYLLYDPFFFLHMTGPSHGRCSACWY